MGYGPFAARTRLFGLINNQNRALCVPPPLPVHAAWLLYLLSIYLPPGEILKRNRENPRKSTVPENTRTNKEVLRVKDRVKNASHM